ncbi:MAG TPA: hypothetical protein PK147_08865 [Saprospiraceae bacterium]|nr:hypothetical protein [Saprospiraceae bacterium]HRX29455.1 hypothetical protein [Saprospiraceae bacterium]
MKKIILISAVVCFFSLNMNGQDTKFGVKAGIGAILAGTEISEVGNEENVLTHRVKFTSGSPIYYGGLFFNQKFGPLFLQTDLLYNQYSMSYEVSSKAVKDIPKGTVSESFQYVDFNISAGLTANGFSLGGGPTIHRLLNFNSALDFIPAYNDHARKNSYGFVGYVMYEFDRMGIQLKYEGVFRSIGDHIYYGEYNSHFKGNPNQLSLLFSYSFI